MQRQKLTASEAPFQDQTVSKMPPFREGASRDWSVLSSPTHTHTSSLPPWAAGEWEEKQEHHHLSSHLRRDDGGSPRCCSLGLWRAGRDGDGGGRRRSARGSSLFSLSPPPSAVTELRPAAAAAEHRACGSARYRIKSVEIIYLTSEMLFVFTIGFFFFRFCCCFWKSNTRKHRFTLELWNIIGLYPKILG